MTRKNLRISTFGIILTGVSVLLNLQAEAQNTKLEPGQSKTGKIAPEAVIQTQAKIDGKKLLINNTEVLNDIKGQIDIVPDELGNGVFLKATTRQANDYHEFNLGKISALHRFMCSYRKYPSFMDASAGDNKTSLPEEILSLLVEQTEGRYVIFLPIMDKLFRTSLRGNENGDLVLVAESGDPGVMGNEVTALFVCEGTNPYKMMESAAKSVTRRMQTGRLRVDKPAPEFMDYFGWCTYDAFYFKVSTANYLAGMKSFADGGVLPGFTILDDGWQSSLPNHSEGQRKMNSFAANNQFPDGLAPMITQAKKDYGLKYFMVWHSIIGRWAGLDAASFPKYEIYEAVPRFARGVQSYADGLHFPHGMIMPGSIAPFYNDFHDYLRRQGVDGVKVDVQCLVEGFSHLTGGRVAAMRTYHAALEGSVSNHFHGNLLNCMSCSNDMLYSMLNSNLLRSSQDFSPEQQGGQASHVYTNAYVSFWMGEFSYTDWDMFWSKPKYGPFHAAARVVGGSPIYVSDKPESHDFDLLKKLTIFDGRILRPQRPGRPTQDCLMRDPRVEDVLLKIFNYNFDAGLLGAFNAQYHKDNTGRKIDGQISPQDVPGLEGDRFAVYMQTSGKTRLCKREDKIAVSLPELGFEIFTIVPVRDGVAPIGLADKFNSAGAITAKGINSCGDYVVTLRDGGKFLAWCGKIPKNVLVDTQKQPFRYTAETNLLEVNISSNGQHEVLIQF